MSENNQVEKSIGEQVADLLERKPQNYDVIFSVGPEKVKVEAVKILLKAASPVFEREFDQNWENAVVREGEGIPLPHLEPTSFKLFVNLIISDTWSMDTLTAKLLNLPPNSALNLLGLCQRYKITKAIENCEKTAYDFIRSINFHKFKDTTEFLKMSRESLETICSCELIPLNEKEVFDCICRWADHQCNVKKIEPSGENFREVLGSCFFEIRFPSMKLEDFKKVSVFKKNLFSAEERLAIYDFIATEEDEKARYDKTQLPFKTNPRNSFGYSVLHLPGQFKIVEKPSLECKGANQCNRFQVNRKISLHGVGFLGPIEGDTHYDVTVQIRRYFNGSWTFDSGTHKKTIFARKGRIFYFLLDAPITIDASTTFDNTWNKFCYRIDTTLMGANNNNVSQFKADNPKAESVQISGVEFNLCYMWNSGRPLAELLYKIN